MWRGPSLRLSTATHSDLINTKLEEVNKTMSLSDNVRRCIKVTS